MSAYPETQMHNWIIRRNADEITEDGVILKESHQKIYAAYPCNFYSPNLFVAIGIGLLTLVTAILLTVLIAMLTTAFTTSGLIVLCVLMAILSYFILEFLVRSKHHYNSGADNVLLILVPIFSGAVFFVVNEQPYWVYFFLILFLICGWLWYRFVDSVMALFATAFLIFFFATLFEKTGTYAQKFMPFFIMSISAFFYFILRLKMPGEINQYFKSCKVVKAFLLIAFYLSGNIFMINEINHLIYGKLSPVTFQSFFWLTTFLIPLIYMTVGFLKLNLLILRTGLFLLAASIFTYKFYFFFLPLEWEMLLFGAILLLTAYLLLKYFKDGKYGFTSEKFSSGSGMENLQSLIVIETLITQTSTSDSFMSGGTGGGGGASGDF